MKLNLVVLFEIIICNTLVCLKNQKNSHNIFVFVRVNVSSYTYSHTSNPKFHRLNMNFSDPQMDLLATRVTSSDVLQP